MSKAGKRIRDAVSIDLNRVAETAIETALGEARPRKHRGVRVIAAGAALATAAAVGQKHLPRIVEFPIKRGLHKLGDAASLDGFTDALRERFADNGGERADEDYDEYDEPTDEADDEPTDEADNEPTDEADDEPEEEDGGDWDDESDDDEPRDEGDAAENDADEGDADEDDVADDDEVEGDDEPVEDDADSEDDEDEEPALPLRNEADGDGDGSAHAPDLVAALSEPRRRPPALRRGSSTQLDPATKPPKPAQRGQRTRSRKEDQDASSRRGAQKKKQSTAGRK
jgi:hypothetical protein